jgi:hypothetical protein
LLFDNFSAASDHFETIILGCGIGTSVQDYQPQYSADMVFSPISNDLPHGYFQIVANAVPLIPSLEIIHWKFCFL